MTIVYGVSCDYEMLQSLCYPVNN